MKTIAIFSSTRGDMSILSPLIKKINREKKVKYLFFVGGTHLIKNYGETVDEIKDLKINIKAKFDYLVPGNKNKNFLESLSRAEKSISKIFSKYNFDFVCVLGDRFEKLAIVNNAIIYKPDYLAFGSFYKSKLKPKAKKSNPKITNEPQINEKTVEETKNSKQQKVSKSSRRLRANQETTWNILI